jgi:tetratricopeptide (TPR) repeat protein
MAQAFYQYRVSVDYDGARRSFEQLRPKLPNSAEIPEALGIIARRQGRWDESLVHTNEAIALNPRDPFLRRTVARVQQATRNFSAALRSYDEALSVWPDDANLIAGKAEVYQALGELDQADALLEKLRPTPESPAGINAIWHQAVLRRRPASVILVFQNWLEQARSLPPLIRNYYSLSLGDLQRLSGNVAGAKISYSQARDDLEQSLKEQPPNEAAICDWLALAYAGLDDRERALKFVERAINLALASKEVADASVFEAGRARIAARFGMKDFAIPALEHLLKIPYFDPLTPALLRLHPDFDPLRGDPRFQKLCEEKKP